MAPKQRRSPSKKQIYPSTEHPCPYILCARTAEKPQSRVVNDLIMAQCQNPHPGRMYIVVVGDSSQVLVVSLLWWSCGLGGRQDSKQKSEWSSFQRLSSSWHIDVVVKSKQERPWLFPEFVMNRGSCAYRIPATLAAVQRQALQSPVNSQIMLRCPGLRRGERASLGIARLESVGRRHHAPRKRSGRTARNAAKGGIWLVVLEVRSPVARRRGDSSPKTAGRLVDKSLLRLLELSWPRVTRGTRSRRGEGGKNRSGSHSRGRLEAQGLVREGGRIDG